MSITRRFRMAMVAMTVLSATSAVYVTTGQADTADCPTPDHVQGSRFEVDTSANFAVDGLTDCIDWLTGNATTGFRTGVVTVPNGDASGSKDDAFGKGTAENDITPTIVSGSIPPNKSDLTNFGVFTEPGGNGGYLALFWARANEPSGTTNMDFELNKLHCTPGNVNDPNYVIDPDCADNGKGKRVTPRRSAGDKLISYDLTNGGITPVIQIRSWEGSSWGPASTISGGANPDAVGSVNSTGISGPLGLLDPFTFGEAVISFEALFGPTCGSFGSAYLKSRSSDSFNAEIKDFVAPMQVRVSNCAATISTRQTITPNDTATIGSSGGATPTGTVTFKLFGPDDADCSGATILDLTTTLSNGIAATSNTTVTVSEDGTYRWLVTYSGDATHDAATSDCGTEFFVIDNG